MSVIALVGLPDLSAAERPGAVSGASGPGAAPASTGATTAEGPEKAPHQVVLPDVATRTPRRGGGTVQLRRLPVPSGSASAAAAALLADLAQDAGDADLLEGGLLVVHALEDEATADALRCLRAQHRPTRSGPTRVVGVPLGPTPLAAATAAELLVDVLAAGPGRAGSGLRGGGLRAGELPRGELPGGELPGADLVTGPAGLPLLAAVLARLAGRLHVSALCPRVGHLADPAPTLADHVRGWLPGQRFLVRRSPRPTVARLGADGLRWEHLLGAAPRVGGTARGRALPERLEGGGSEGGVVEGGVVEGGVVEGGLADRARGEQDGLEGWELVVSPDQAVGRRVLELLEPLHVDGVPQRWLPRRRRRDDVVRRGGVELVLVPGPAAELVAAELAAVAPTTCGWCRACAVPPSCAACGSSVRAGTGAPGGAASRTVDLGSLAVLS